VLRCGNGPGAGGADIGQWRPYSGLRREIVLDAFARRTLDLIDDAFNASRHP
jgi:hypothetical protein